MQEGNEATFNISAHKKGLSELIRPLFTVAGLLINKESEAQLCDEKQSSHTDFDFQKRKKMHFLSCLCSSCEINSAFSLFPVKPCNRLFGFKVKL